jgi:glycosyltransferase involved in cell wall biosynthesis
VSTTLTAVIPVLDQAAEIGATVAALEEAAARAPFVVDVIVVDDGSTDGSGAAAERAARRLPLRVLRQENAGRLAARRAGLAAAEGELVLFLDSRVLLDEGALAFVASAVAAGETVWNGHVDIATEGNPYGLFWDVITCQAFSAYFSEPRTTSFGAHEFDRFPKGTTCFLAPRPLLVEAFAAHTTRYADARNANDDTPIIRWIAERRRVGISPGFRCLYLPRSSLRGFVRHARHRGVVFLDGHATRESRFFPVVCAFFPASLAATAVAFRRPSSVGALAGALAALGALVGRRDGRPGAVGTMAVLTPVYAAAHGLGMWKGLGLAIASRPGRRR